MDITKINNLGAIVSVLILLRVSIVEHPIQRQKEQHPFLKEMGEIN